MRTPTTGGWRRLATPPNTPTLVFHTVTHAFRVQRGVHTIADGFWTYAESGLPRHRFDITLRGCTSETGPELASRFGELDLAGWCREVLTRCAPLRCSPELLEILATEPAAASPGMLDGAYDLWVTLSCPVPFYAFLGLSEAAYETFASAREGLGLPRGVETAAGVNVDDAASPALDPEAP